MVGALGHAVRATDRQTRMAVLRSHAAGLLLGSMLMGSFLSALGALLGRTEWSVAPAGAAFGLVVAQLFGGRTLQSHWQVPEAWRRGMDLTMLAAAYGLLLGTGVLTAIVVAAFWVFAGLTIAVPVPVAIIGWLAYATSRGIGFAVAASRGQAEASALPIVGRTALIWIAALLSLCAVGATFANS